ncbi:MAG TPA: oligoendopeptidase F [Candidatus Dormibacteraeota bacterium]|nr:oligoendopeptidase F [Candidatus Dormibacteraeota bacterium]
MTQARTTIPTRGEVAKEYTWNTESVFATDADFDKAFQAIERRLPDLAEFKGHLGDGAAMLADWVAASEQVAREMGFVRVYAYMFFAVDSTDQEAGARQERTRGLGARLDATMAFAEPEILAIGEETLRGWIREEPRLAGYEHALEVLQGRREHVRSAEVEELLSEASDTFGTAAGIHGILANADLRFPPAEAGDGDQYEVAQGTINALLASPDRDLRRTAWESYADAHLAVQNTMAACLATGIKRDVFVARARRYRSSLEAALTPNHIPVEVFHKMLDAFGRNLPTWHRYWAVRRRALRLEQLHVHDTRAMLTRDLEPLTFQQAVDWVLEGVAPLGEDYGRILRRGLLEERWVDVYPNKGKRMGAFSMGSPGTHPFIFMSYNDDIFSMSTLAHEIGHSMHSHQTRASQPFVYARYGLFVAEVASNFHQALVRAHLLETNSDPEFQISVIEEAMANYYRYFFVMPSLARFELEVHQRVERGEALPAAELNKLMADLMLEVYGGEVVLRDGDYDRIGSTWAQFHTHLYSNFYVYQYATGIAGANWLAERVLSGDPGAPGDYLAFIRSGSSLYPLDALRLAGVDMTKSEPMDRAFEKMASLVSRLEELVAARPDPRG